jgi:hypothetical protein
MITTEFKLVEHSSNPFSAVLEVWFNGQLIGAVYPSMGPGIRVMSKFLTPDNTQRISLLPPQVPGEPGIMEVPLIPRSNS